VGLTRRGKSTKAMLVTEGAGLPAGLHLDSAQKAEVALAAPTLETVKVRTPAGRLRTRPQHLVADKGYDSRRFHHYLRGRGIGHTIPPIVRTGSYPYDISYGYDAVGNRTRMTRDGAPTATSMMIMTGSPRSPGAARAPPLAMTTTAT